MIRKFLIILLRTTKFRQKRHIHYSWNSQYVEFIKINTFETHNQKSYVDTYKLHDRKHGSIFE